MQHQNAPFWGQIIKKFSGEGSSPLPRLLSRRRHGRLDCPLCLLVNWSLRPWWYHITVSLWIHSKTNVRVKYSCHWLWSFLPVCSLWYECLWQSFGQIIAYSHKLFAASYLHQCEYSLHTAHMFQIRRVRLEDLRQQIPCDFLLRIFTVGITTVVCFEISSFLFLFYRPSTCIVSCIVIFWFS